MIHYDDDSAIAIFACHCNSNNNNNNHNNNNNNDWKGVHCISIQKELQNQQLGYGYSEILIIKDYLCAQVIENHCNDC